MTDTPSPASLDLANLREGALEWQQSLLAPAKLRIEPAADFWYPYGTLNNFIHLEKLLHGPNRFLLELAGGLPVADIGAADGDLIYFFEQVHGLRGHIIDHASTNFNGLRGARRVKEALGSSVEIHDIDLDALHVLPAERYGLIFFLGILYHLKNPYYALESLAQRARHCLVSTRVARFTPDKQTGLQGLPVAYLLHATEANNDATNFWIFSEAGLRRIFHRTGWDVVEFTTVGNIIDSDPASQDGDERAFALLRSRNF